MMTLFRKIFQNDSKQVHISIRQKILFAFFLAGMLVIFISLTVYYFLLIGDIRSRGEQHVGIAFDMMFDELNTKIRHSADTITQFTQDTLSINMFVLSVSRSQLEKTEDADYWERWRSIQEFISRLRAMTEAAQKFAVLLKAADVRIYDSRGELMVLYQQREKESVQGIYFPYAHDGTFLPLKTIDAESWYWQKTEDIPETPMPKRVQVTYPDEIPKISGVILSRLGKMATIRFTVPVFRGEKLQGFCVIHTVLSQHDMERYSRYSQTYINIFAGSLLSVGTMPVYNEFSFSDSEPLHPPDISDNYEIPSPVFSEILIKDKDYYQGRISFGDRNRDIITLTANFSRHKEVEKARKLTIPIISIAVILGGLMTVILALLLQIILIRPLKSILRTANAIAEGDVTQDIRIWSRDEIGELADAFRYMKNIIENVLHDMEQLTEAIESGQLDTYGNPDAYAGSWRDLIISTNNVIDAFVTPITMTATCLNRLSKGDMPEKIADEYKGDFDEIRNNLNMLIDSMYETIYAAEAIANGNLKIDVTERSENDRLMKALNQMIQKLVDIMDETNGMIQAVSEERLNARGDTEAFEGGWRELIVGINNLIDGLSSAVSEKTALGMEMELAKKIQTCLLPEKPEIQGYEISASCEPSEKVGGDYYDVISAGGFDWLVIGDVSGHGVTAGLVMMMVQTAIHTVLNENPETEPSRLLLVINKTIYNNIEMMNESKHMTIIVLASGKEGKFSFSGLHEDILIRRAKTGKVEKIESDGMWIGLEADISKYLSDDTLQLETGDCMVLFTDGITEAFCEEGELFGDDRLIRVIEESGEKAAAEIRENIINALEFCEKPDDVTLVVMKRV